MATYSFNDIGGIEIDFNGVKPSEKIRKKMKSVNYRWNPKRKIWWAYKNNDTVAMAKEICGEDAEAKTKTVIPSSPVTVKKPERNIPPADFALKVKIKDIVAADKIQLEIWGKKLKEYVNEIMGEDNTSHSDNAVSKSQESVWLNCFKFIASNLSALSAEKQEFELIFEYSLPGTVHERPDVFLLTDSKVLSLEFKKKEVPQMDANKDDVAQAIRYKEYLENHHKVTRDRAIDVRSYLVCTHKNAVFGNLRGIDVLTKDNFCSVIEQELENECLCSYIDEWLCSTRTEMPDMLQAIEIMYRDGSIPYISDVNENA